MKNNLMLAVAVMTTINTGYAASAGIGSTCPSVEELKTLKLQSGSKKDGSLCSVKYDTTVDGKIWTLCRRSHDLDLFKQVALITPYEVEIGDDAGVSCYYKVAFKDEVGKSDSPVRHLALSYDTDAKSNERVRSVRFDSKSKVWEKTEVYEDDDGNKLYIDTCNLNKNFKLCTFKPLKVSKGGEIN